MVSTYWPIALFSLVAIALSIAILMASKIASWVLRVNKPSESKNAPFECGFEAFEEARMKFDVRFYLVAILFIIFDLEMAFVFPWAMVIKKIGVAGFASMGLFVFLLFIGFLYEWKKGALEWE